MAPSCGAIGKYRSHDGPWKWCTDHAGPNDKLLKPGPAPVEVTPGPQEREARALQVPVSASGSAPLSEVQKPSRTSRGPTSQYRGVSLAILGAFGLIWWASSRGSHQEVPSAPPPARPSVPVRTVRRLSPLEVRRKAVVVWWNSALQDLADEVSTVPTCLALWRQAETQENSVDEAIGKQDKVLKFGTFVKAHENDWAGVLDDDFPDGWGDVYTDLDTAYEQIAYVFEDADDSIEGDSADGPIEDQEQYLSELGQVRQGILAGRRLFKAMGGRPSDLKDFGLLAYADEKLAQEHRNRRGKRSREQRGR